MDIVINSNESNRYLIAIYIPIYRYILYIDGFVYFL